MTDNQARTLAQYIIDYISYEWVEYGRVFDYHMINDATEAYLGGAR
jgi:hypothetical protein